MAVLWRTCTEDGCKKPNHQHSFSVHRRAVRRPSIAYRPVTWTQNVRPASTSATERRFTADREDDNTSSLRTPWQTRALEAETPPAVRRTFQPNQRSSCSISPTVRHVQARRTRRKRRARSSSESSTESHHEPGVVHISPSSQLLQMQATGLEVPVLREYVTLPPSSTRLEIHQVDDNSIQAIRENLTELSNSVYRSNPEEPDGLDADDSRRPSPNAWDRESHWIAGFLARKDAVDTIEEEQTRRWSFGRVDSLRRLTSRLNVLGSRKPENSEPLVTEPENENKRPVPAPGLRRNSFRLVPTHKALKDLDRLWTSKSVKHAELRRHKSCPSPSSGRLSSTSLDEGRGGPEQADETLDVVRPATAAALERQDETKSEDEDDSEEEKPSRLRLRRAMSDAPRSIIRRQSKLATKVVRENMERFGTRIGRGQSTAEEVRKDKSDGCAKESGDL